jgi:ankyrin repeat protein
MSSMHIEKYAERASHIYYYAQGGATPLHVAASNGSTEIAALLLKKGNADANAQDTVCLCVYLDTSLEFPELLVRALSDLIVSL